MFTENVKPRRRGRPAGQTAQGAAAKKRLYDIAIQSIARQGYAATTLRGIADEAGVSVGLLYRYFPSKQALVLALYDELSADYVREAAAMPPGKWRDRFAFALKASLRVLAPHRVALRALIPVLIGDPDEGIFAASTAFSRRSKPPTRRNRRWPKRSAACSTWPTSACCCGGCSTAARSSERRARWSRWPNRCCRRWRSRCAFPCYGDSWCRWTS